jgi:hypothetical protein
MTKRAFSLFMIGLIGLTIFPLSVFASSIITSAQYAGGVVSVSGTGFTGGTAYLVRVVDTESGNVTALDQVVATSGGSIHANITTGELPDVSHYTVKVNASSGALVASHDITAEDDTLGTGTPGSQNNGTGPVIIPVTGSAGTISVTVIVDSAGRAGAAVSEKQFMDALAEAVKAAEEGSKAVPVIIEIRTNAATVNEISLELSGASIAALADSKVDTLIVTTGSITMKLEEKVIETIKSSLAEGNVSEKVFISIALLNSQSVMEKYSSSAKQNVKNKIGDRPMYELTIVAGNQIISDFHGGTVGLTWPYTLQAGENPHAIVVYYLDGQGKLKVVTSSRYNSSTHAVSFQTNHFSQYAVGYNKKSFADVADGAWYNDAVTFAAARGITEGVSETQFAPNHQATRGDFLVLLMRAYGIDVDDSITENFADAGNTYYTAFLGTAKKLGMVAGVGNNRFEPQTRISRQDMLVMIYNILDKKGELPAANSHGKTLNDYKDKSEIGAYALPAMKQFVESGIVAGNNGYLMPKGFSTRAEIVQVLYNMMNSDNSN